MGLFPMRKLLVRAASYHNTIAYVLITVHLFTQAASFAQMSPLLLRCSFVDFARVVQSHR